MEHHILLSSTTLEYLLACVATVVSFKNVYVLQVIMQASVFQVYQKIDKIPQLMSPSW